MILSFSKSIVKGEGASHIGKYYLISSLAIIFGLLVLIALSAKGYSLKKLYMSGAAVYILCLIPALRLKPCGTKKVPIAEYKKDAISLAMALWLVLIFVFAFHWGAEDTCYGLFLKHYLHLSQPRIAAYMLSEFVFFGLTAYFAAIAAEKFHLDMKLVFVFGLFLSGVTLFFQVNHSLMLSMSMRMLHGVADGLLMMVIYVGMSRIFKRDKIGGNIGIYNFVTLLGALSGALLFSRLGKYFGYNIPFVVSGGALIVSAFISLFAIQFKNIRTFIAAKKKQLHAAEVESFAENR